MNRALERARRRPVVFLLVYGAFLVLIGITATAQAVMTSSHLQTSVLASLVTADRAVVGTFLTQNLTEADLTAEVSAARFAELRDKLGAVLDTSDFEGSKLVAVEIVAADGTVVFSTRPERRGVDAGGGEGMATALAGDGYVDLVTAGRGDPSGARPGQRLVVEDLPITVDADGTPLTLGAVHVVRDGEPIINRLDRARTDVVLTTLSAAAVVAVLLFFIFRSAQGRISRQTAALIESARRDPVTNLLNHGTAVEALDELIGAARSGGGMVALGILDLDGFSLLNEVHGHAAGDDVLRRVADRLMEHLDPAWVVGRFGPDEFIVAAPGVSASNLEGTLARFRRRLAETSVQFGGSEQLPVTFSAGVASFPEHAASVTELISSVTLTLSEARSSGGDAIRIAARTADERADARGFDVLQGLVIAVDTKDRYTKRHSEDVARYAVFLARRMGLDEEFQSTIRLAGLLHDVGKIGIPDGILRKPGQLTADESEIVKQHVALGDAIVRDLPNIELVRAGIRHHHERWDGHGYLDQLAAAQIPLIARILSVADVFSAMTTTRPYRKALPLTEALKRLGDGAGTQLDETLVAQFIAGIETAPDAPLPGQHPAPSVLWKPVAQPG